MFAAVRGNASKVAELLSEGGRVDAREQGFTPLMAASDYGHTEVCELLLERGSDVRERKPDTQSTPLHFAALKGHKRIIQLLLSHKADVNSRNRIEGTPLHAASQEGHLASVATLLQAGADPLLPQQDGALPIHLAASENHSEVVRILIEQGGCSQDQVRHTALQPLCHLSNSLSFPLKAVYHVHRAIFAVLTFLCNSKLYMH